MNQSREAAFEDFNRLIGLDRIRDRLNVRPLVPPVYNTRPVCRCGLDIMEDFPIADALGQLVGYRCPQCFRLVMVSLNTGQQMWYQKECQGWDMRRMSETSEIPTTS